MHNDFSLDLVIVILPLIHILSFGIIRSLKVSALDYVFLKGRDFSIHVSDRTATTMFQTNVDLRL